MTTYIRLTDYKSSNEKEQEFFNSENRYEAKQEDFSKIPGSPVVYWVSDKIKNIFNFEILNNICPPRAGLSTADNDRFLRYWSEINFYTEMLNVKSKEETKHNNLKWFPHTKGGGVRKWYGNNEFVVNWENDGQELYDFMPRATIRNPKYYFQSGLSWSDVGSTIPSFRYQPIGYIANARGPMIYTSNLSILAQLNSKITIEVLKIISPTLTFNVGEIAKIPINNANTILKQQIETLTQQNIDISKEEWDSRETSWDFKKNELIKHKSDSKIETAYENFCNYWKEKFNTLHQNEEELNRLFIDIYELQDELTPVVELKDITILKNETKIIENELVFQADEIMKQFISYGVGVMFGRYSLDSDGLLIANMGQKVPTDTTFEIDDDNVIPVLEDDYFKDDIAARFVQFVKATFGEEDLSENIRFIENSLGTTLRKYFVKGFYEDHIKRYKKRPIYWMVASPKKGFMSLIYMHRYEADIFARVRNSYLTEYIAKLEAHKETLALTTSSDTASNTDKKDADKQMKNIDTKLKEIIEFDRDKMMSWSQNGVEIDLDDGVKVNYCKFEDILYPIKGLCKK